ncbi:MBL fold metallo-hydrolase [Clostridium sp. AWRP]|nr:MBL fold metallo-hydrolase [Clostridium sp. AWRP]
MIFLFTLAGCGSSNNKTTSQSSTTTTQKENSSNTKQSVSGNLKVHYINVGQGDSELIQQGDKNMLIDTGTNASTDTLISYLQSQNIKKIDYLVLTHPHEDHIGGADAVINKFDIGTIYMPKVTTTTKTFEDVMTAMKNKNLKATTPNPGDTFKLGEASCEILGPINSNKEDLNTYSIVMKVTFGSNKFMFTGDAQASNEEDMINKGYDLSADVLKVGHHGSHTSTSENFLNKVNPKYAVISCGKNNDYGHPHKETMERLQSKNISVYRTDESGTIVCTSDGNNITFSCKPGDYKYGSEGKAANSTNSLTQIQSQQQNSSSSTTNASENAVSQQQSSAQSSSNQSETVYITKTGHKYHRAGCKYLARSQIPISLGQAESEGYTPCSKCNPPQ